MTTDMIPRPALLLGWAGVIPFVLLTAASALDIHPWSLDPTMALRAYGACILSFMGGAQWGVLLPREGGHVPFFRYLVSVLPALLAFLCLLIPNTLGLIGLRFCSELPCSPEILQPGSGGTSTLAVALIEVWDRIPAQEAP